MNIDILAEIIKHGLSVRQVPITIISICEIQHKKEGDEIIIRPVRERFKNPDTGVHSWVPVERPFCKRTTVPKHAGYWMCQIVNNTSSQVQWDFKRDNLAPTLPESVKLYLDKLTNPNGH